MSSMSKLVVVVVVVIVIGIGVGVRVIWVIVRSMLLVSMSFERVTMVTILSSWWCNTKQGSISSCCVVCNKAITDRLIDWWIGRCSVVIHSSYHWSSSSSFFFFRQWVCVCLCNCQTTAAATATVAEEERREKEGEIHPLIRFFLCSPPFCLFACLFVCCLFENVLKVENAELIDSDELNWIELNRLVELLNSKLFLCSFERKLLQKNLPPTKWN